jgi:hypothetical protein
VDRRPLVSVVEDLLTMRAGECRSEEVNTEMDLPRCGTTHDRDENAGINLARLPASWAEAQSDDKTAPSRHAVVKRVDHLGRVAA